MKTNTKTVDCPEAIPNNTQPNESHPLLGATKKNGSDARGSSRVSRAWLWNGVFILFILTFLGAIVYVKVQDIRHYTCKLRDSTCTNGYNVNNNKTTKERPWWDTPVHVDETNTVLPGLLPKTPVHQDSQKRQLRWGILGLGRIAKDFTAALKMTGANVTAAAAGSLPNTTARAKAFAETYSIPQNYGSYEELAADENVDIVYIANLNTQHYDAAMMMLQAGKNVLLEKPMTMDYEEAKALAKAAKKAKRFLLTNFWTRFFPVVKYVRTVLASNRLGPISAMRGDFGFAAFPTSEDRDLRRSTGGGAMLDLGCYLVNLAVMVNPSFPQDIESSAQTTYLGRDYRVDTEMSFSLNWNGNPAGNGTQESNASSTMPMIFSGQTSFRRPSSFEFEISASRGRLVIHNPANAATAVTVYEYEPYGPMKHIEEVRSELPEFDVSFGPEQYPRGEGFVYIIHEIEQCMFEKGIPGADDDHLPGCLELDQLSIDDQLLTVRITEAVMNNAGYWDW